MLFFISTSYSQIVTNVLITIPEGIRITEEEIRAVLPPVFRSSAKFDEIEILVYHFSPGIETLSVSQDTEISQKYQNAYLKILVKFKKGGFLKNAVFIEVEEKEKEGLLRQLSEKLKKIL